MKLVHFSLIFMLTIMPFVATGTPQSNSFVYPKGYSELSKKRVDQLRKIHPIFEIICSGTYEYGFQRDDIVTAFEKMHRKGEMDGRFFIFVAGWSVDKLISDPIERLNL